jgi:hypothetical protein
MGCRWPGHAQRVTSGPALPTGPGPARPYGSSRSAAPTRHLTPHDQPPDQRQVGEGCVKLRVLGSSPPEVLPRKSGWRCPTRPSHHRHHRAPPHRPGGSCGKSLPTPVQGLRRKRINCSRGLPAPAQPVQQVVHLAPRCRTPELLSSGDGRSRAETDHRGALIGRHQCQRSSVACDLLGAYWGRTTGEVRVGPGVTGSHRTVT